MLADDEPHILQFLELGLINEGYEVRTAENGSEALDLAREFRPHVAVLDVMMPEMNGFEVCQSLKETEDNIAVIMLTAKDDVDDRVKGLKIGADDYVVKPFSFNELLARIEARLRNQFPDLLGEVVHGPFQVDDRRKEIRYQSQVLELSPTEYELLKFLVLNHGIVLSKVVYWTGYGGTILGARIILLKCTSAPYVKNSKTRSTGSFVRCAVWDTGWICYEGGREKSENICAPFSPVPAFSQNVTHFGFAARIDWFSTIFSDERFSVSQSGRSYGYAAEFNSCRFID